MTDNPSFGQLVDCTEEEFRAFCSDKDLGYIMSFHNLMVQTFEQVKDTKNGLVAKIVKSGKQSPEEKTTLEGLYSKLFRIEQRVFILREIRDALKLPVPEVPFSGT